MEFNINTATNSELLEESKKIEEAFKNTQTEAGELVQRMQMLSEAYEKIQSVLKKRGINNSVKNKG